MSVTVQDLNGKVFLKKTFKGRKEYQIDISDAPDGTYNIIINSISGTLVYKLVKIK